MPLTIPAPHGHLEALLQEPPAGTPRRFAAVVCHPHPQYGGTMHNKVVYHTAKALVGLGGAVLRFNFRGVGLSTGSYDEGRGEREDVLAALDLMAERFAPPLWLAGFSFGAFVGVPVGCADARVAGVLALGMPVRLLRAPLPERCDKPLLVVQGSEDAFGPLAELKEVLGRWPAADRVQLEVVAGADHFFTGRTEELRERVQKLVGPHLPG